MSEAAAHGKRALSVRTVARMLDCPMREVEAAVDRGELRGRRLGRVLLIDPESVRELLPWDRGADLGPDRRPPEHPLPPRLARHLGVVGSAAGRRGRRR